MQLKGLELHRAKVKHNIDKSIFIIKHMIVNDYVKEDMDKAVEKIKKTLSDNYEWLGEDFCIDKGAELDMVWKDFLKYSKKTIDKL